MRNLDLFRPPLEMRELNLLQELEKNRLFPAELSNKFGIALGVTNACLKGWFEGDGSELQDLIIARLDII